MGIRRWAIGVGLETALLLAMSCGGKPESPPRLNLGEHPASVILIVVDTLRADHLGLYEYERPTSPTLDAWAKQGRVFDNALAPSPWTLPSFGSLYTGRWPLIHQAGMAEGLQHPSGRTLPLGPAAGVPTLAETLRAVGYRTLAVANNPWLAPTFGMARGFDVYDFDSGASNGQHRPADEVVQRALELVDDVDEQPFLLVVHLFEPHLEYNAPPPFRNSFSASIRSNFTLPIEDINGLRNRSHDIAPQDRAFVVAAYDEEIAYVDEQLGVLRDGLAGRELLDTSMIVLTSDHGEELFDHGGFEHGHAMWQELIHVPLVVWAPGVEPGRESAPVSLVDVMPTVLDTLGIASPTRFDGISLWPNLSAVVPLPDRPLFAEGIHYGSPQSAVVRWPHKIIVSHQDDVIGVFDLERDPHERNDLTVHDRDLPDTLIAELCRHQRMARRVGTFTDREAAEPGQDVIERLRSLGYLRVNTGASRRTLENQFYRFADSDDGPVVHVRWVQNLGDDQRMAFECSLGLHGAEHSAGSTWRYRFPDGSSLRHARVVEHEMVADAYGFDRTADERYGPVIHVRWVQTLGDDQRMILERALGLYRAEHAEGTSWRYRLPDASPERLRPIVSHSMVEDTHGFDRATMELDRPAGR